VTRAPGITNVTRRVVAVAINITSVKARYVLGLLPFKLPESSCWAFLPEGVSAARNYLQRGLRHRV